MSLSPTTFWDWFCAFADRLPQGNVPDAFQESLLSKLHRYDKRLYFLISTNTAQRELIITADGNKDAFQSAELLVSAAPNLAGWTFIALKPAMGFDFTHSDGPISLDVSKLWFKPTESSDDPPGLGVVLGLPDIDFVLHNQSVDTAYTILETSIGERCCTDDIAQVTVDDLPATPEVSGYLPLPKLPDYIAFHKRRHGCR